MSDFRSFIEQVRGRNDIVDVIGGDVALRPSGGVLKGLSPFHAEMTPSFVVWPATQTWHDFSGGGGRGGDVFSYLQERKQLTFRQAVFELAVRAGVSAGDSTAWARDFEVSSERRDVERLLTAAAMYYHRVLPSKIRDQLYRRHYGLTDELIDTQRLGWANGHLFHHLTDTVGVTRELALKTGLFVALRGGDLVDLFRERLVFPYWRRGRVVYFIARSTTYTSNDEWEHAKYKKQLTHSERYPYVSPTVRNDYFFNEDAAAGADELLITEGITDCLSAMQAGVPSISPATTRFREQDLPRLVRLVRGIRRVTICNDAEENGAGDRGATHTAASLWSAGCDVAIARIPRPPGSEKIDINSLVSSQGPGALRSVLAAARGYPEYLLEQIPPDRSHNELERELAPVIRATRSQEGFRFESVVDAIVARFGVRRRALQRLVKKLAREDARAAVKSAGLPQVQLGNRHFHEVVTEAAQLLERANERRIRAAAAGYEDQPPLFSRGGNVVELCRRKGKVPALNPLTVVDIYGVIGREAEWVRRSEDGWVPTFPPKEVARDLLSSSRRTLPALESVISTPAFGQGGGLLASAGLHRNDAVWLEMSPDLSIPEVPARPSQRDVEAAKVLFFDELFCDFNFAGRSDRAHALAALLLPFARRLVHGCTPLHVVEAPSVGAGKTLLCNLISVIATGESCGSRTLPESDDETRKMLTAELGQARPIILLDNASERRPIAAPSLASVLTGTEWTDRELGRSSMITLANRAVWMLTGNNVRMSRDIARRSVRIRIDPKTDRAWARNEFKHDPILAWAKSRRSDLVHAALLLIQAWLAAGAPPSRTRLGSFEEWSAVLGGILEVNSIDGFLANAGELFEDANADEQEAWRQFTEVWWEAYAATPVHVADLAALCDHHDLMHAVRGEEGSRSQQSRLGRALHRARGRCFGNLRLVVLPRDRLRRASYALEQTG